MVQDYFHFINSNFFNIGPMVAFIWKNDPNWSVENVSRNINENFGYTQDDFLSSKIAYANIIHPDDIQTIQDELAYAIEKKLTSFEHKTYRIKNAQGEYRWVKDTTSILLNKDTQTIEYFVGYIIDVTNEKDSALELEKTISFLKSYQLAIDESNIVSKSDLKGNITYANKNFCDISGYCKSEVIGKPHNILRHPDTNKEVFKTLWETIKSKKTWKGVLKNKGKTKDYWVDITILPILDEQQEIEEFIAIRHDITLMMQQKQELENIANIDSLTGLGNRYKLVNDINYSICPALAIINIDDFSLINDFYGHNTGDMVIKKFGTLIEKFLHQEHFQLYHLKGDEYVIFHPNVNKDIFTESIHKIRKELEGVTIEYDNEEFNFNFSVGISFEDKTKILSSADMALKIARRNNSDIEVYTEETSLNKEYENNIKWARKIKEAIANDKIIAVYQPIVNNQNNQWEKYEALVRLEDEDKLISPFFFLDISKKTKHYNKITKIMIKKSFEKFKNSTKEFSINLTVDDILNKELQDYIFKMLEQYKLGSRVVFEIVESESIENFSEVECFIKRVKKHNCKIAIDDFGTGYSNFEYLMKLKADIVKIDGSMIKELDTNKNAQVVVSTIVDFAKKMGMKTVAEFVENESILNKVKELGIDYSQGYYFSAPKKELEI